MTQTQQYESDVEYLQNRAKLLKAKPTTAQESNFHTRVNYLTERGYDVWSARREAYKELGI